MRPRPIDRLIDVIFGTDEEIRDEIAAMTPDDVKTELEAEGIDLTEKKAEMHRRFAEIRARNSGPWASEDPSEMCRECGHTWEQHDKPLPAPCGQCNCIGFTRKPHVKVLRYRGFEIWLYEDGDGDWQAGLIDNERNDYDHGLTVLNAMEYSIVLGEAKGTCDAIRADPDWYGDNEEGPDV